ncbi:MAG TPA: ATP-binding protein [bacterium]|nr:ATP-binding protein [bacterium]
MISPHRSMRPGRGHAAERSASLVTQLAIAFVAVALVTVAVVAFWVHRIADQQLAAYHERIGLTDSPPDVRELILRSSRPMRFALSQRRFLEGVNRSLWFGGGTAAVFSVLAAIVLAHRFAQPLRKLQGAASAVASGNLDQSVPVRGGGELEDVAAAFNLMTERLRESERQRHQLLAAVAHELRTPLAIIQGNLEAMLFQTTAPTPERLSALHTQSALLNRLITDLLDLSLAEAGQLTLHRRATDLAALCREAVEVMQPWIDERGVKVEIQVVESVAADADPDRMRQVIHNLLHNAIRYTSPGGVVRARTTSIDRSWVELIVEDDGPGIPPEDLPSIFEPFYRADPSRSRASGGSGLGLGVVKQLVIAHGGRVYAENRAEGGSRFAVVLPAAADPTA